MTNFKENDRVMVQLENDRYLARVVRTYHATGNMVVELDVGPVIEIEMVRCTRVYAKNSKRISRNQVKLACLPFMGDLLTEEKLAYVLSVLGL